jgi:hypothetical protein
LLSPLRSMRWGFGGWAGQSAVPSLHLNDVSRIDDSAKSPSYLATAMQIAISSAFTKCTGFRCHSVQLPLPGRRRSSLEALEQVCALTKALTSRRGRLGLHVHPMARRWCCWRCVLHCTTVRYGSTHMSSRQLRRGGVGVGGWLSLPAMTCSYCAIPLFD